MEEPTSLLNNFFFAAEGENTKKRDTMQWHQGIFLF